MRSPGTPTIVPLPEVANHTDQVIIHKLGTPEGFDESRLGIDLVAFQRVQRWAGLGVIHITTTAESLDTNLSGITMQADGAATISLGGAVQARPKTGDGSIGTRHQLMYTKHVDATVVLQETQIDDDLKKQGPRAPFDPQARAQALNRGIRSGLQISNAGANMDIISDAMSVTLYGSFAAASYASYEGATAVASTLVGPKLFDLLFSAVRDGGFLKNFRESRKSLFFGASPDRWLIGAGVIASGKFIVPQEKKD